MYLTDQKKQALELYVNQSYTQQQIADSLGVCVRTVFNWIKQHAWDRLRLATHQAAALIADNFSSQLVELQNEIATREPGKRYPTTQEMEIMRKLTVCINNTKKTISLPQVTQMMRMFRGFIFDTHKKEDAVKVADAIDSFLEARSRFGYAPYDLEFGVEKVQSVDPIMNPYSDTSEKPEEKKKPNLATVRIDEDGNKIYTVDTSRWSEKVRKIYEEHFGKLPEEETTYTFATDEKPLIINDLVTDTPATTGKKSAIPATHVPANPTATTGNESAILATYESATPTATTGNKPAIPATNCNPEITPTTAQFQPISCQSFNPENPDSDKNTTGKKPTIPATHESATPTATIGNKPAIPANPNTVQTAQANAPLYPPHLNPYRTPSATTGKKPANQETTSNPENTSHIAQTKPTSYQSENPDSDQTPHATTGNKPAIPATTQTPKTHPDNLIRQGEVFSRPVYIKPTWPFREDPPRNKYRY